MLAPRLRKIIGTTGNEDLIGANGAEWIFGDDGNDRLYAKGGDDFLFGGAGNDLLDGGEGRDVMYGGSGNDTYRVDNPGDVVSEESTPGIDDGGVDTVQSSISYTIGAFVEKLQLTGSTARSGTGNDLDNNIKGNDANNILSGGMGRDTINGGAGDDILIGGEGKDYLTGGEGSDTFVLGAPIAADADKIYDFSAEDRIGIYARDYGLTEGNGLTNGQLDPQYFTLGSNASSLGHGQFIYNSSNATLYWDPDGKGGAAKITVATLTVGASLAADDFKIMNETPAVSIQATTTDAVYEDSGYVYFLVELETPAREDVVITYSTLDGSATGGQDFVAISSAQVVIPAGSGSAYVRVEILDDPFLENEETFSVVLQSASLASDGQPLPIAAPTATATIIDETPRVVSSIDTAALGIPDPSGIAYDPVSNRLFLSDSEVDEAPFYVATDLYAFSLDGTLQQTYDLNYTDEATGLAYDPTTGNLFISDDDSSNIYCVDPANPGVVLWQFNAEALGCDDPEDVAIDPTNGHLFVVNGESRTIVELDAKGTQTFGTITLPEEIKDPEALAYDAETDVFYVGGGFSALIWCVDRNGEIIKVIDTLVGERHPDNNTRVNVKDIEIASSSDGSGGKSLYVADFGWSHVNDGRIIELDLGDFQQNVASHGAGGDWGLIA